MYIGQIERFIKIIIKIKGYMVYLEYRMIVRHKIDLENLKN